MACLRVPVTSPVRQSASSLVAIRSAVSRNAVNSSTPCPCSLAQQLLAPSTQRFILISHALQVFLAQPLNGFSVGNLPCITHLGQAGHAQFIWQIDALTFFLIEDDIARALVQLVKVRGPGRVIDGFLAAQRLEVGTTVVFFIRGSICCERVLGRLEQGIEIDGKGVLNWGASEHENGPGLCCQVQKALPTLRLLTPL